MYVLFIVNFSTVSQIITLYSCDEQKSIPESTANLVDQLQHQQFHFRLLAVEKFCLV